jgi:hypothetical protein
VPVPAHSVTEPRRRAHARRSSDALRARLSGTTAAIAASLGVAALSLVLPSIPSYDAWAWAVWGKEILALDLDTRNGPSWKPLPVVFTTVFAPFGDASPQLWVLVARAGGALALVFAYRLAARFAGPIAGAAAAVGLALVTDWVIYLAHGLAEPLGVALILWAIERHLDGRRDHAFALGFVAALIRPEIWPFLGAYAVLVWLRDPARRPLVAAALVALPIVWLGPDWWGSGDPLTGKEIATQEPERSLSRAESPTLAVLDRFREQVLLPLELAAVFVVAVAARRRERVIVVLAALVVASVALVAAMTEQGFSGNSRYLLPAAAVVCVLGGVGLARALAAVGDRWRPAVALALVAVGVPFLVAGAEDLREQAEVVDARVEIQDELALAIERAGGVEAVRECVPLLGPSEWTRCGRPAVNTSLGARLVWELRVPFSAVTNEPEPPGLVFRAPEGEVSGVPPTLEEGWRVRLVATAGKWDVLAVTPPP